MGKLAGGRPFISGGHEFELHVINGILHGVEQNEDTLELYDIDTGTWQLSPPSPLARWRHAAIPLRDGSLLLAGTAHHLTGLSPTTVDRYFAPGLTPPTGTPTGTPTSTPPATPTATPGPTPSATPAPETSRATPERDTAVRVAAGSTATVRLKLGKATLRALKGRSTDVTLELTQARVRVQGKLKRS